MNTQQNPPGYGDEGVRISQQDLIRMDIVQDNKMAVREQQQLAQFLNGRMDHDMLWNQFDLDGSGYLEHGEFKRLISAVLTLFLYCQMEEFHKGDENFERAVPTEDELAPRVEILFERLLPKMDGNNDGSIDKEEFMNMGEYIESEFAKQMEHLHEDRDLDENVSALNRQNKSHRSSDVGFANMAQEVFHEVEELEAEKHEDTKGQVRYFDGQIIEYQSEGLIGLNFWTYFWGTVVASPTLWLKIAFLCFMAGLWAVFVRFVFSREGRETLDLEMLSGFMGGFEAVVAFFCGFYLDGVVNRWWVIRSEGIGGVCKSITDISLIIAGTARAMDPREIHKIRNMIIRLGLLAHSLIYLEAQGRLKKHEVHDTFENLQKAGLIRPSEVDLLIDVPRKFGAVWGWMICYLQSLMKQGFIPDDRFEQCMEMCREGRKAASLTLMHVECQLPLPYVHLICLMTNLYQQIFAGITGIVLMCGIEQGDDQKIVIQMTQFLLFCTVYQGILETVEKMANPLGIDDIDIPRLYIQMNTQNECKALFSTAMDKPFKEENYGHFSPRVKSPEFFPDQEGEVEVVAEEPTKQQKMRTSVSSNGV